MYWLDPYYLAQKAQEIGYHPEMILAARKLNECVGEFVANEVLFRMIRKGIVVTNATVLILGITFKENCPDIRNTRVLDIHRTLEKQGARVEIFDPHADKNEVQQSFGISLISGLRDDSKKFDAIIHAVAHQEFLHEQWRSFLTEDGLFYDVKGIFPFDMVDARF